MLEFILNNEHLNDYHSLKFLEINNINIEVEILEVRNLTLSNDFGKIDSSAPFEPFGSTNNWFFIYYWSSKLIFISNK